jgi:hypothetical protein
MRFTANCKLPSYWKEKLQLKRVSRNFGQGPALAHKETVRSSITLWRNRPMRDVIKFRNLKERDCATVAERCRVLRPLLSPLFAPRVARLRGN